jgi:CRP-like cAMP-binding protein
LFQERDRSNQVLIIRRGCVKVVSQSADGRQTVLAIRGAGEMIGEIGGLAGTPRMASVVAIRDVEALAVPASWFARFLRTHLDAGVALQTMLATRLYDADRSRTSAMVDTVERRLANVLLDLADRYGQPAPPVGTLIDLPLSHDDIAGLILTSVRTLDRALVRLRRDGIVVTRRRAILVKDMARLRELAGHASQRG